MTDRITLRNLAVFARHGVFPEEAALGQRFTLDVTLRLCLRAAGRTDALRDTVDYGEVVAVVSEAFAVRRKLIEAAADTVAGALIERFPAVASVDVVVRKPGAPIAAIFDHLEVAISRSRDD
ncbi:MAG: dihydroneopterin aldolase [Rubrimonas sp.]